MKYKFAAAAFAAAMIAAAGLASCAKPAAGGATQEAAPATRLPQPTRAAPKENGMNKNVSGNSAAATAAAFSAPLDLAPSEGLEYAVLAGGCFWCLEAVFEQVPGVSSVISGYTGGATARPSYEEVSSGTTGHAEAVAIAFDPAAVSYAELLDYFWKIHDPTTKDRQGADVGTQYRSAIYYVGEAQRRAAEASIARESSRWPSPVVTELKPAGDFWAAEAYHQDFYRNNPNYGYCAVVIAPKLKKAGF